MKKQFTILSLLIILFFSQKSYSSSFLVGKANVKTSKSKVKYLKRVYNHFELKSNQNVIKKSDDIMITFEDFSSHFEIGKTRILSGVPGDITMDIGEILSGQKETWTLPNLSTMTNFETIEIQQMDPVGTDIYDSFGYGSHLLYSNDLNIKELYDLTEYDLYFVGYNEIENNELIEYQYEQTKAPIPIELGIEFTSIVKLEDPEFPENYIEYTDTYYVIGQGTLKTYDDGDADSMKMIYKEETREFENNVEVSYSERYEIIFYSKRGHYVKADISDPWNSEGVVTLQNLNYQKLEAKTASVNDEVTSDLKVFPNPINAGETLTIQSQISLENNVVEVFNVSGQKVSTLKFTQTNNNQYQTLVPEKLASGIYFYKVHNQKGSVLKNGKIQVK